jgi:hypothetical protein
MTPSQTASAAAHADADKLRRLLVLEAKQVDALSVAVTSLSSAVRFFAVATLVIASLQSVGLFYLWRRIARQ